VDVEILLLRRQLAIDARQQDQPMRLARGEELTPVVVATEPEAKAGLWGPKSRSAADSSLKHHVVVMVQTCEGKKTHLPVIWKSLNEFDINIVGNTREVCSKLVVVVMDQKSGIFLKRGALRHYCAIQARVVSFVLGTRRNPLYSSINIGRV
jgi:hypothetical protein